MFLSTISKLKIENIYILIHNFIPEFQTSIMNSQGSISTSVSNKLFNFLFPILVGYRFGNYKKWYTGKIYSGYQFTWISGYNAENISIKPNSSHMIRSSLQYPPPFLFLIVRDGEWENLPTPFFTRLLYCVLIYRYIPNFMSLRAAVTNQLGFS